MDFEICTFHTQLTKFFLPNWRKKGKYSGLFTVPRVPHHKRVVDMQMFKERDIKQVTRKLIKISIH